MAEAPSETKTSEKPRMKNSEVMMTWRLAAALTPVDTVTVPPPAPAATGMPRISSSETPEMNDR